MQAVFASSLQPRSCISNSVLSTQSPRSSKGSSRSSRQHSPRMSVEPHKSVQRDAAPELDAILRQIALAEGTGVCVEVVRQSPKVCQLSSICQHSCIDCAAVPCAYHTNQLAKLSGMHVTGIPLLLLQASARPKHDATPERIVLRVVDEAPSELPTNSCTPEPACTSPKATTPLTPALSVQGQLELAASMADGSPVTSHSSGSHAQRSLGVHGAAPPSACSLNSMQSMTPGGGIIMTTFRECCCNMMSPVSIAWCVQHMSQFAVACSVLVRSSACLRTRCRACCTSSCTNADLQSVMCP